MISVGVRQLKNGLTRYLRLVEQGHAVLVIKSQTDAAQVTITRTLARSFTFAGTDDYQKLRDFYEKVAAADQEPLVLTTSGTQAGPVGVSH